MKDFLITAAVSYLLGSIPFGYLLVRLFRGEDVRQSGSGNIGATNVARKSPALGALTLLLDAAKGFAAVAATRKLFPDRPELLGLAALIAIIGHMFPLWLGFRGGKGVATGLGSFVALVPKTILLMVAIFAVILFIFRYVALASILTAAVFPLLAWLFGPYQNAPAMLACMTAASLLIIAKHHANISRLLAHTEPRFREKHS
jgi:acyl phosphate:glycerol-3-phosphate acyltransferase